MSEEWLSITDAAREVTSMLGQLVRPRDISNLLYDRELREDFCPKIGNRHVVSRAYVPEIARILRRKGWGEQTIGAYTR